MKRPKVGELVKVYWQDAAAAAGWRKNGPALAQVESVGFVLEDRTDCLTLAGSVMRMDDAWLSGNMIAIPWPNITRIVEGEVDAGKRRNHHRRRA